MGKNGKNGKRKSLPRRIFRAVGIVVLVVVVAFGGLIGFLSATEYKPKERTEIEVSGTASETLSVGDSVTVLTWNVGYGALGDNADFFMDGGTSVKTADEARVRSNMDGMIEKMRALSPQILLCQETDRSSSRSEKIDETALFSEAFPQYEAAFANNFKVAFLPYPVPPIGKVDSGLLTLSAYHVDGAERIQLPIPFSWPVRMANLKRCLLVERIPLAGSDKQLVIVNLHLEAYDDGEGKIAQTKKLREILDQEAQNGNYVIAGGDFNQIFSSADVAAWPVREGMWQAGEIPAEDFADGGWQMLMDGRVPTCRSLDQPYAGADHENFQYYLIDGFIVSRNIRVDLLETQDFGFVCTDHNPVLLKATLA